MDDRLSLPEKHGRGSGSSECSISEIRVFHDADLATINSWLRARGLNPLTLEDLPSFGVVTPEACGFLVSTDTNACMIECLVSDPKAPKRAVHRAFIKIIRTLIEIGKARGYTKIYGLTSYRSIGTMAMFLGFNPFKSYFVFKKEL